MPSFTLTLYLEEREFATVSPLVLGRRMVLYLVFSYGGGLTPGCQTHPATISLSLLDKIWEENTMKVSWVELRTGRSHTSYCHRLNRLILGKTMQFIAI